MRRVTRRMVNDLRWEQRGLVAAMEAADFAGPDLDRIHDKLIAVENEITVLVRS